jgi:hypothetical protein
MESEHASSATPSSLLSLTASPRAASQYGVVAELYGIGEGCLPVLRRSRALRYRRVLLASVASRSSTSAGPSYAPSESPSLTPASVRTGLLSCSRCCLPRLSLTVESEHASGAAPSSLSSLTASLRAASQYCVVAELYGIGECCLPVLRRSRALRYRCVLLASAASSSSTSAGARSEPSESPRSTPASVRTGSLSCSRCCLPRLSLTVESEHASGAAPSSLPSLTASLRAASQYCVVDRALRYRRAAILAPLLGCC